MTLKQFVDRYGVSLGVVLGVALVIALLPGNARGRQDLATGLDDPSDAIDPDTGEPIGDVTGPGDGGGGEVTTDGGGGGGATGGTGGGGGATDGGVAPGAEGAVQFGTGPDCDANGRQKGISGYMPPCVQWNGTDNGGATATGVTGDKVKVVAWLGQEDPATRQALTSARLNDSPAVVERAYRALFKYSNQHYQTYGREVQFEYVEASGPSDSDEAMRADALKIANMKPFAVFTGNALAPIPTTLARELARRGVVCICTTSLSSEFYNELPATIFSSLPTINEYAIHAAEYAAKRLGRKPAKFGGTGTRTKPRVYCVFYVTGVGTKVDPEGKRGADIFVREFAKRGITFKTVLSYLYDPGSNQNDITNKIARFKRDGCTTIIPLVDPIQPILITREATKQVYFPEWFIVGTGLSDTTTIGRFYDQQQWSHAFGISPLWVTWDRVETSSGYREYHHAVRGASKGSEGVLINIYRSAVQTLFRGIHMAGPILNNDSFARGIYAYPKTGGRPASPLVYVTRKYPTEIKDFSEVWYDPNRVGPDERSETAAGMMVRADGGRRYGMGEWPTGDPSRANPVTVTAEQNNPPHEQDGHTHDSPCLSCG